MKAELSLHRAGRDCAGLWVQWKGASMEWGWAWNDGEDQNLLGSIKRITWWGGAGQKTVGVETGWGYMAHLGDERKREWLFAAFWGNKGWVEHVITDTESAILNTGHLLCKSIFSTKIHYGAPFTGERLTLPRSYRHIDLRISHIDWTVAPTSGRRDASSQNMEKTAHLCQVQMEVRHCLQC